MGNREEGTYLHVYGPKFNIGEESKVPYVRVFNSYALINVLPQVPPHGQGWGI